MDALGETSACTFCGNSPCFIVRFGDRHLEKARQHKLRAGNSNKKTRFYLHRRITKDRLGILGRGCRVRLPRCVEMHIKSVFPNEDGAPHVGFQDSNAETSA